MRLPFLQFYFLLLCNVILIAQTNIKTYEGHWEGELKNQHVFNFDVTLKILDNEKYVFAISNDEFTIQKETSSSDKNILNFSINESLSFSGVLEKDGSEINGFISAGIYFYHIKLEKHSNNTYRGRWNIFILDKLLSKDIFLSIENINNGAFDAYPFFGDKRFAGTWCMNSQKKKETISFQDFRTGLHFKGKLLKNAIDLDILLSNKVITSVHLKKSTKEWQFAKYRISPQQIQNKLNLTGLEDSIQTKKLPNVHSVLISKKGNTIYENYFEGYNANIPHDQRSASKSITSAITGIAIEQGLLKNEQELLYKFIPNEYQHTKDSLKSTIKIVDLLTMSAGFDVKSKASEQTYQNSPNWLKTVLSAPLIHQPGTIAEYGSANPYLLGVAIEQITPTPTHIYMDQYLFKPLNISNYTIQKDLTGTSYFAGGIYMTPRDMLKFGELYLQKGTWKGKQILSKEWIDKSFKTYHNLTNVKDKNGYGYLWWHHSYSINKQKYESIEARGNGGQYIFIIPKLEVVCIITAGNYNSKLTQLPESIFQTYILPKLTN